MSLHRHSHVLALAITFAGASAMLGACGGSAKPADAPETAGGSETDSGGGGNDGETAGSGDSGDAAPVTPPKESTPLSQSQMLGELEKLGLDPKKLPSLGKMKLGKKKKIMPLFQKSLGMKDCNGCHVEGDFKAKTRNTKIAAKMWEEYVLKMRDEKGGALFCDSCHNGSSKILAREDKDAVSKFMEDFYEGKLTRADGEENACSTCHDSMMETAIIEKLWNIK